MANTMAIKIRWETTVDLDLDQLRADADLVDAAKAVALEEVIEATVEELQVISATVKSK